MSAVAYIYTLRDPSTGEARYVGRTVDPDQRLAGHLSDTRRRRLTAKHRWIKRLLEAGTTPLLHVEQEVRPKEASIAEKRMIRMFAEQGADLLNVTHGPAPRTKHTPRGRHRPKPVVPAPVVAEPETMALPKQRTFTVPEVAAMLGVSDRTVYNMIGDGRIPTVKAGRTYIITRTHLAEYAGSENAADDLIANWERTHEHENGKG